MDAPADNATRLNFLTRDGAVTVLFSPTLDSSQYDELRTVMEKISSRDELQHVLSGLARRWNRQVSVDP